MNVCILYFKIKLLLNVIEECYNIVCQIFEKIYKVVVREEWI